MFTITAAALALSTVAFQTSAVDRVVDASGVKLHVQCDGARKMGMPMVVLEAGAGNSAKTWNDVFAPIAQFTRVCAYDRPGLGTSEQTSQPRLPAVRLYAMNYPAEVVGLILIDSSHEDQLRRFAEVASAPPIGGAATPPAAPSQPPREVADLATMGTALKKPVAREYSVGRAHADRAG